MLSFETNRATRESPLKYKLLILAALVLPHAHAADTASIGNARYTFDDRAFASLFEKTLILGHTLSADFMVGMVSRSVGPGTVLAEKYANCPVLANLSEPRALSALQMKKEMREAGVENLETIAEESRLARRMRLLRASLPVNIGLEAGLDKIARLVYRVDDTTSPMHRLSYLEHVYAQSTSIVGVDALYLAATTSFDSCSYMDVADVLEKFVDKTFADGKVVVLGNVPQENYATFSFLNKLAIYPQIEDCRARINAALREFCTPGKNCYLVDLEQIVSDLDRDGYLTLKDGTKISRVQTRPDGVNLSNRGTHFVVERILSQLRAHPPRPAGVMPSRAH